MRSHPLREATIGEVLAIKFDVDRWGFGRIHRGALAVWDCWVTSPQLSDLASLKDGGQEKWFFHYMSPKREATEMKVLGAIPFASLDEAWPPPCFYPPSVLDHRYRIYFKDELCGVTEQDVVGLPECECLWPPDLVARLQSFFAEGLLRPLADTV